MFMIRKTQSLHFKHCDVYVVVTRSPVRCREHSSYIHPHEYYVNELRSFYNIHYLFFIKQRVNKNWSNDRRRVFSPVVSGSPDIGLDPRSPWSRACVPSSEGSKTSWPTCNALSSRFAYVQWRCCDERINLVLTTLEVTWWASCFWTAYACILSRSFFVFPSNTYCIRRREQRGVNEPSTVMDVFLFLCAVFAGHTFG